MRTSLGDADEYSANECVRITHVVPIAFCANSTTAFTALGDRFLNEAPAFRSISWVFKEQVVFYAPCTRLCKWTVYSRVTTSESAERVLPV